LGKGRGLSEILFPAVIFMKIDNPKLWLRFLQLRKETNRVDSRIRGMISSIATSCMGYPGEPVRYRYGLPYAHNLQLYNLRVVNPWPA
jgi:hypothetical protein